MSEKTGVEERRTRRWVNVVRIGLEFDREDGRGGRVKTGGTPAG